MGVGLNSPGPVTSRSGDQRQHKLFTAEPYFHGNSNRVAVVRLWVRMPVPPSPLLFTLPVRQLFPFLPLHSAGLAERLQWIAAGLAGTHRAHAPAWPCTASCMN